MVRLQTPIASHGHGGTGSTLPQGSFQSISGTRTAEAQCRLPISRPPIAPPPPIVVKSESDPDEKVLPTQQEAGNKTDETLLLSEDAEDDESDN